MPDDGLIDAHHHVWDLSTRAQDWLGEPVYSPIRRTYTVDDLRAEATHAIAGRRLTATVLVQCLPSAEETEELLAQAGPETFDDPAFGIHFAFFSRTDRQTRLRILEGRRRRVEERREGLRDVLARAAERLDAYTLELQRHGLEAAEREVRWLEELIATERSGRTPGGPSQFPGTQGFPPSETPERSK